MPAPMPPQGAPAAEPQAAPEQSGGGASQLVGDIHSSMLQLMDLLDKSPAVTPEDKQMFGGLITGFQSFVKDHLGAGPGQKPPGAEAAPQMRGNVPPEAGNADVKPAL